MLPINFTAVLLSRDGQSFDTATYIDIAAVSLSALVGLIAFLFKFSTGLTDVLCGSRGYDMDPEIIDNFLDQELQQNPNKKGCCQSCNEALLYGCSND